MRLRKSIVSLAGILMCVSPMLVQAEIYQWKDAHGVTHYSGIPPQNHAYIHFAEPNEQPGLQMSSGAPSTSDQSQHSEKTAAEARQIPALKQRCQIAKKDMAVLQTPRRIRIAKPDGKVIWLNQSQRSSRLKQTRSFYNRFCNGS